MSDIEKVLRAFTGVKANARDQWRARCPCHDDKKASLFITWKPDEDKILIKDFGGCSTGNVLDAVGLTFEDLEPEKKHIEQWWEKDLIDRYDYKDDHGRYLYSKLRYTSSDGKVIRYARITGDKYMKGDGNAPHVLYNLQELIRNVKAGRTVFYVEGEKDVKTMSTLCLPATTAGGTSDWNPAFARYFTGAKVVILGDNDKAGRDLAARVERDLLRYAFSVKTIFPSEEEKGDITDYIEAGNSREDLFNLIKEAEARYAAWFDDKKCKVNTGLLAETILQNSNFIVARHPGLNTDLLYLYAAGYYQRISEDEVISNIIKKYIPIAYQNPSLLRNVASLIKYGAREENFEELNHSRYINVRNGLIDITDMTLHDHDPECMSTIQINADYRPDSEAKIWKAFIRDLCSDEDGHPDSEKESVLQEITGWILSPVYGYKMKKAFILTGREGNTGKSTYLSVIENLLGREAYTTTDFRKLASSRWATGKCFGKRLVVVGDQGSGEISDSSTFKAMTGSDPVDAEFKGMDPFTYQFKGVIVLACNQPPYFTDDKGEHLARRIMFIPCVHVIPEGQEDKDIVEKMLRERDGILSWALQGFKRLKDNGYRFSRSEASDDLLKEYRAGHDTLYAFITSECDLTDNYSEYIGKHEFEDAYFKYCIEHGLEHIGKHNIKQRAAGLGITCKKLDGNEVYRKIRFKELVEDDDIEPFDS